MKPSHRMLKRAPLTRKTRELGFVAFTGFALLVPCIAFGLLLRFGLPPKQPHPLLRDILFPGGFLLVAALAMLGQLGVTMSQGCVYCGHVDVIRRRDDALMYWVYCLLHASYIAGMFIGAYAFLR